MGLNFGVLLNAAMGGSAAYAGGRRAGHLDREQREARKLAAEDAARLRKSQIEENEEQAADRKYRREHPEEFRTQRQVPEHEARTGYINSRVGAGRTLEEAAGDADLMYGRNTQREQGPVRGTPEWEASEKSMIDYRNQSEARYRRPLQDRDTGEAGSAKAAVDRREFFQKRIPYYTDKGYSGAEAQAAAEREFKGAEYSAANVTRGASPTAQALGRSIPRTGSGSFNAGTRGVRPTETSSTQRSNPNDPNSPKAGALKEASDADIQRAILAVGKDKAKKNPAAVEKWLADNGFAP